MSAKRAASEVIGQVVWAGRTLLREDRVVSIPYFGIANLNEKKTGQTTLPRPKKKQQRKASR